MIRKYSTAPLFALSLTFALTLIGCSEDVNQRCGANEEVNPISGECVPRTCAENESYNPVNGTCIPDGEANGSGDGGNGSGDVDGDGSGDFEDPPDYDPDCPFNQDCTDDGSSNPGGYNPGGDYDPFQPQDPDTATYHSCEASEFPGIQEPQFVLSGPGDYLLAISPSAQAAPVAISGATPRAHFIEHQEDGYTGFVVSVSPRAGQTTPQDAANWLFSEVSSISGYTATREGDGQSYRGHDNFRASVLNHVALDTTDSPAMIRDKIAGRIYGVAPGDFSYDLENQVDADGSGAHLVYKVVWRSDDRIIIVGGITTQDRQNQPDSPARFALQDLAGGTALALAGETMTDQCISLELRDTQEVDIIISMDASGSMSEVQSSLSNFSDTLVQILDDSGIDWRIAVTGADCHDIRNDDALRWDYRELWPDPETWESPGPSIPFPFPGIDPDELEKPCMNPSGIAGAGSGENNGRLMEGTFTTDPAEIADRIQQVSTTGFEYTLTMGMAAIEHSLPRADNDPSKIRTNAAVVVIAITDENEEMFKKALPFLGGDSSTLSASERAEMEEYVEPWLSWLLRPDVAASVFGLYWVPGQNCAGADNVAHGIHHVVEQTGGVGDSVCSPNINQSFVDIANASLDITTGLRLIGNPFGSSVRIDVEDVTDQTIANLPRNVEDGFDFDSATNSLFFYGPSTPDEGKRLIVPYLSWNRTIIPCAIDNVCPNQQKCVQGRCS